MFRDTSRTAETIQVFQSVVGARLRLAKSFLLYLHIRERHQQKGVFRKKTQRLLAESQGRREVIQINGGFCRDFIEKGEGLATVRSHYVVNILRKYTRGRKDTKTKE